MKEKSPLYASITFNDDATEATVVLGSNDPKVFKSKLGVNFYMATYLEGDFFKNALTKEKFQNIKMEDLRMFKAVYDIISSKNVKMPASNEEDIKLLENSPFFRKMPKVTITIVSMKQEPEVDWPMKEPMFEVCSNCKKSGKFVDNKNPNSKSERFFAKQDALAWLQMCVQKKQFTKDAAELLAKQVHGSDLAGTYAEYLANLQKMERCTEN